MAYEKQTWQCGETITADKLNHMEDGIEECCSGGGSALIVKVDHIEETDDAILIHYDKTYQEVKDAYDAGLPIYFDTKNDDTSSFDRYYCCSVSDPTLGIYGMVVRDIANDESITMLSPTPNDYLITQVVR